MDKIFDLKKIIINTLDSNKALDIVSINLENKSSMADYMIIASGTSSRHIQALSEQVLEKFKSSGIKNCKIEGKESKDWKLIDGIDVIVHIFNPEKRKFYELEKMWSELIPKEKLIFNSDLTDIKKQDKLKLSFRDNNTEEFDYLVAADGIYSKTKQILFKKEGLPYISFGGKYVPPVKGTPFSSKNIDSGQPPGVPVKIAKLF